MAKAAFGITARQEFVRVELQPGFEITLDAMRAIWRDVLPVCERQQVRRVLVEGDHPTRAMRKLEVLAHGRFVANLPLHGLKVAFCLHDYETDQLSYLFTLIANVSPNTARFFDRTEDALTWLAH